MNKQPGAIEMIEQATGLLRSVPAMAWLVQAAGTLFFIMVTLKFLADMGKAADAAQRLVPAALGLALAYGLMKHAHALFGHAMLDVLQGGGGRLPKLTLREHFRLFSSQLLIHSTMPWLMFLSLLAILPSAWTHASFHNASILGVGSLRRDEGVRELCARSLKASHHAPRQNHGILVAIAVIAILLGLNLLVTAFMLPQLARMLSGSENALSLNSFAMLNTSVLGAVVLLTWFAINPFSRACYTLRCFHFVSRRNGDDLRAGWRSLARTAAAVLALGVFFIPSPVARADTSGIHALASLETTSTPPGSAPTDAPAVEKFNREMDDVLSRPDFQWRLPREKSPQDQDTWFGRMMEDVLKWIGRSMSKIAEVIGDLIRWFTGNDNADVDIGAETDATGGMGKLAKGVLIVLLVVMALALVVLAVRWLVGRRKTPVPVAVAAPVAVDLEDESVTADALPEDEWLRLAREKWASGDHRLAVRALFLGTLARLGETGLLAIASGKTNGIYLRELKRQSRAAAPLRVAFQENVGAFEATWYGDHPVDDRAFDQFSQNLQTIRQHASPS